MISTGKRFARARQVLELTQQELAAELHVEHSFIEDVEEDRRRPSSSMLQRFIEHHSISSDWILTGEGDMFIDHEPFPKSETIPLIDIGSHTGYLEAHGSDAFVDTLTRYKLPGLDDCQGMRIFEVEGDAMLPTFYPGDYVICARIEDPRAMDRDTLGVVIAEDGIWVNRLNYFDGELHDGLILQSDKSPNPPRMIKMERVREVWQVQLRLTTAVDHILLFNHQKFVVLEQELRDMKTQLEQLQKMFDSRIE